MNTTFAKYLKAHTPVGGSIATWQRMSCIPGNVGRKF